MQILYGFLLAVVIAYLAYRARSLDKSGAFAAIFVGTIVFGLGGLAWAILLLIFFITSSGLSRAFKKRKQGLSEKFSKGSERDAGQVFGNGGVATIFVLVHALYPESLIGWVGFAASLAAVNADTWATELGVLNPTAPSMVTDLRKRVEKGTSGGVSLFGTFASLLGAAVIALPATLLTDKWSLLPLITIAGLTGSLFDSLLGATVQRCTSARPTKKRRKNTHFTPVVHRRFTPVAGNG
jgi:uncharacterized protein (TIGR00297 family)